MLLGLLVIIIYSAALALILLYCLVQFHLALKYVSFHNGDREKEMPALPEELPHVTVQLPLYNELYVTERLLDAVAAIDWPADKLEIQVLDDSTDESVEVGRRKVEELAARGIDIQHIRREDRKGFKAGALQYGLEFCKGEFVAIFDADFVPKPDFLKNTIGWFQNPEIGVVQTRWEHLNRDYSLMTRMQAFALDLHFSVEQLGRFAAGYFINFNGTAGVWRKQAIDEAGGWNSDTLTEDMDLSYRAQLKGWKFMYREDVGSPAELPTEMSAIKSQQFRWNKGGAETARKLAGRVLRAKLPLRIKFHAVSHLLNTSNYIWIFLTAMLSIPLLWVKHESGMLEAYPWVKDFFLYASVFLIGSVAIAYAYYVSTVYRKSDRKGAWKVYLTRLPIFLAATMGLSLHNAMAVLRGWAGQQSAFIRTPKFAITGITGKWHTKKYASGKIGLMTWMEGLLALYFLGGIAIGLYLQDYGLLPFHLMAALGFSMIFYLSVRHARIVR